MKFDKSKEDLEKMMSLDEKLKYEIAENESSSDCELPIVVFAVGADGSTVMIDNPNHDKLGRGVEEMLQEEFDNGDLCFDKPPGVYIAEFYWFTHWDYWGDYDTELIVNNMTIIFDYDQYVKDKGELRK